MIAEILVELGLEPGDATVLDRVLESRVLAIRAVTEITLHQHDLLGDIDRLLRRAEADDFGEDRRTATLGVLAPERESAELPSVGKAA